MTTVFILHTQLSCVSFSYYSGFSILFLNLENGKSYFFASNNCEKLNFRNSGIAASLKLVKPITEVADELGISQQLLKPYGKWKAKVGFDALRVSNNRKLHGKLIVVTAMTPTPYGEGKTVTSIGLAMALSKLGHRSIVCLRQPSLGPVFGIKGGAAGGGKSTVEPMADINMRFTGDIDAVGAAHNLLAALLDNHLFHGNQLGIDWRTISWRRVMDMNDRALRRTIIGLGGKRDGVPREDGFIITAASEVMAVLCLAKDYADLKRRLGRIIVGYPRRETSAGRPTQSRRFHGCYSEGSS